MRKWIVFPLIFALLLTACAKKNTPTPPPTQKPHQTPLASATPSNIQNTPDMTTPKGSLATPKNSPLTTLKPTAKPTATPSKTPVPTLLPGKYLSPNAPEGGDGSMAHPYNNVDAALRCLSPGDTLYLRGGVYELGTADSDAKNGPNIRLINFGGTKEAPVRVFAYPGEFPIIDLAKTNPDRCSIGICFIGAKYLHLKGIEIRGMTSSATTPYTNAVAAIENTQHCTFEQLNIHDNGCIGMSTGGVGFDHNLFLNCDFHHNFDPFKVPSQQSPGGNADGLGVKEVPADCNDNIVRGCRFYYNSDDGLDTFRSEGRIRVENCWMFRNGYIDGSIAYYPSMNGNGFKIGNAEGSSGQPRVFVNCMSFCNKNNGFDDNACGSPVIGINNTAFGNENYDFYFNDPRVTMSYFYNNFVVKGRVVFDNPWMHDNSYHYTAAGNSWQNVWKYSWANNLDETDQVKSTDWKLALAPRKADGNLPDIDLFRPIAGSRMIDGGIANLPQAVKAYLPAYIGKAPDMGAIEKKQ